MGQLQDDLDRNLPSSEVSILAINEEGQESDNGTAAALNDLPLLQDVDADSDDDSDVWKLWWPREGPYLWTTAWRDLQVIDADGELQDLRNLTTFDLREQENYDSLRQTLIDIATAGNDSLSQWQNRVEPLDVNNDGFVTANDALRIINRINDEGAGELSGEVGAASYYDVTGDSFATSLDVLRVIRQINIFSLGQGEPDDVAPGTAPATAPATSLAAVDAFFAAPNSGDSDDDE